MNRAEQVIEIIDYAIARLEKAKKYGLDMNSSKLLCLEDAKEHIENALSIVILNNRG